MQDEAGEAVPALIAALDDLSVEAVENALGRIGPAAATGGPRTQGQAEQEDFVEAGAVDRAAFEHRQGRGARPRRDLSGEARNFAGPGRTGLPTWADSCGSGKEAREAAPVLQPYLTDKRPAIRAAAAVALGAIAGYARIGPALVEILNHPHRDPEDPGAATPEQDARAAHGRQAALVLGWIGPPARSALPTLRDCLKEQEQNEDSDWNDKSSPFPGLIGIMIRIDPAGKLVVPSLFRAIRRGDEKAMLDATMLEPIPEVVLKVLAVAANDDRHDIAQGARDALARIGPAAAPAVPALIRGLDGESPGGAARALGAIGPAAREAVPALERKLKARKGSGMGAAIALLRIDPTNRAAKECLARETDSLSIGARAILAGSLGQWSPEAEGPARQTLFMALNRYAMSGHDGYSSALCDPQTLEWLGKYGPGARTAVPELSKLLTHRDRYVRRWAADALRRIEGKARSLPARGEGHEIRPAGSASSP